jgi:hypothetical protein
MVPATMLTLSEQELLVPAWSVAVNVTGVVPMGKFWPEVCDCAQVRGPQSSAVAGPKLATAPEGLVHVSVTSESQAMFCGAVESTTLTECVQVWDVAAPSTERRHTVVLVPNGNVEPLVRPLSWATEQVAPGQVAVSTVHVASVKLAVWPQVRGSGRGGANGKCILWSILGRSPV